MLNGEKERERDRRYESNKWKLVKTANRKIQLREIKFKNKK